MKHYFLLNGTVFGIKKFSLDELYQVASGLSFWSTVPLFFVNITENGFLTYPRSFKFDLITLSIVLLNFFYLNGVYMYLVPPRERRGQGLDTEVFRASYDGDVRGEVVPSSQQVYKEQESDNERARFFVGYEQLGEQHKQVQHFIKPDARSIKITPESIVIKYPDDVDNKTVRFTYDDVVRGSDVVKVVFSTMVSTPENSYFVFKELVHPEYTVFCVDGRVSEEIKYQLPSFVRESLRVFADNVAKRVSKSALEDMFRMWFVYSQKAHAFPPKTLMPEDLTPITNILKDYLKKEKEEYEKLERERKKIQPK